MGKRAGVDVVKAGGCRCGQSGRVLMWSKRASVDVVKAGERLRS